jgi:large subunit ribosomal protein L29
MSKKHDMSMAEVRKMTGEELDLEVKRLRNRVFQLRTQSITDKVADNSEFASTKKNIARLLTERTARTTTKTK